MLGHVPMLAHRSFADMCQLIGEVSLRCEEEDVPKLANVFWHFVEFGLVKEGAKRKAFGAAVVSCIDELHNATSNVSEIRSFDPKVCATDGEHPLTELQPYYYMASSLAEAITQIKDFVLSLNK